jgi:predicted PurR-regulated permease PerM
VQSVLIPFVVGALLFYALAPAVDWLQRVRVTSPLASATTGAALRVDGGDLKSAF